jgi:hypothetical protein
VLRFLSSLLIVGLLTSGASVAAQDAPVPQLNVGHLAEGGGPVIDGIVDKASWASTQPFSAFIQQERDEGEPATERTEVRFILDQQNVYRHRQLRFRA